MKLHGGQRLAPDLVLRERIAEGGQGEVWRAYDERTRADVAVKVLRAGSASRYVRGRFEQEARVLAMLDHPGLTRLLRYDLSADRPWIALELAAGVTLAHVVAERYRMRQPLEARWARVVIEQVAEALAYAHANGVVHRDLKPSNIIVGERARLVDFGVAKLLTNTETQMTTAMRGPVGTLSFFAPEQIESGSVTVRTDVHAMGVLVFAMLSGESPWHDARDPAAEARSRIIQRIQSGERPRVTRYRPDLAPVIDGVLMRAMAIDPAARYPDVSALAKDLSAALSLGDDTIVDGAAATVVDLRAVARVESVPTPLIALPSMGGPIPPLVGATEGSARALGTPVGELRAASRGLGRVAWPVAVTVWGAVALVYLLTRSIDPAPVVVPPEPDAVEVPREGPRVSDAPGASPIAGDAPGASPMVSVPPDAPPIASATPAPARPPSTPHTPAAPAAPALPPAARATPAPSPAARATPASATAARATPAPSPAAPPPAPASAVPPYLARARAAVKRYQADDASEEALREVSDAIAAAARELGADGVHRCARAFDALPTAERAAQCLDELERATPR